MPAQAIWPIHHALTRQRKYHIFAELHLAANVSSSLAKLKTTRAEMMNESVKEFIRSTQRRNYFDAILRMHLMLATFYTFIVFLPVGCGLKLVSELS